MNIGICGSHRTGKTTLAEVIAKKTGIPFIKTHTTDVFKKNGINPAKPMDFETRLRIQHLVLKAAVEVWRTEKRAFVTDRTPVDMMAYTLADIQGSTEVDFAALKQYLHLCFVAANKYFKLVVVIQPGIPLRYEEGKAALNRAYLEHLNTLVIGLCNDERFESGFICLSRALTGLDDRAEAVLAELQKL